MQIVRAWILLVAVALICGGVARAQRPASEPKFAAGDVELLDCRVMDVRAAGNYCNVLTVEVSNAEKVAAEPLVFRIALEEKRGTSPREEKFARTTLPRVHRFGRPTPAGGKQKYWLATSLIGKRPQYAVQVASASFYEGDALAPAEFVVGKSAQVQMNSLAGTFPVTKVELENPLDHDLDLLFLVTFTQPSNVQELRGVHLAAGEKLGWALTSLAGAKTYLELDTPPGCAMKATSFELVDWSLVGVSDPAAGPALLRAAHESWLRWPDPPPSVSGKFQYRERRLKLNSSADFDDFEIKGRFNLDAAGKITVAVDSGTGANPANLLDSAFANLRRESWESMTAKNELRLIDEDRVEIRGPGFGSLRTSGHQLSSEKSQQAVGLQVNVRIRDGRIAESRTGDGAPTIWETRELDSGYVVTQTRSPSSEMTYSFQRLGSLVMPERTTSVVGTADKPFSSSELLLSDLSTEGATPFAKAPPTGAGAAALRAIWDAGYRLTSEPIRISAGFEVLQPGTDLTWANVKKIKGTLEMVGVGRNLRSLQLTFEGKLSASLESSLVSAFHDRLLMWYGRDLNDRADFDEFFAGTTIDAAAGDGSFRVDGGSIETVLTESGLVRGWVYPGGSTRRFTYQNFDGRNAVTRIDTEFVGAKGKSSRAWTESVAITLDKVGEHLLPTNLLFTQIFGKEWGPETLKMSNLKLR